MVPEVSGFGVNESGTAFSAAEGGPAKGTRKRKSEVAMDSDTPAAPLTSRTTKTVRGDKSKRRRDESIKSCFNFLHATFFLVHHCIFCI